MLGRPHSRPVCIHYSPSDRDGIVPQGWNSQKVHRGWVLHPKRVFNHGVFPQGLLNAYAPLCMCFVFYIDVSTIESFSDNTQRSRKWCDGRRDN
jgi:hypothetical protein